jgi:hypothetical protein
MNESENQFSFTREASSISRGAKKQIPISYISYTKSNLDT